jgi:hypothetical protein
MWPKMQGTRKFDNIWNTSGLRLPLNLYTRLSPPTRPSGLVTRCVLLVPHISRGVVLLCIQDHINVKLLLLNDLSQDALVPKFIHETDLKSVLYITEPDEPLPRSSTWLKGDEIINHEFLKSEVLDDDDETDTSWKSFSSKLNDVINFVTISQKVVFCYCVSIVYLVVSC